jgi:hypothetical protein
MRSRGNPNWGKPTVPVHVLRTEFEQQVEKLRLSSDEYQDSPQLKKWCLKNAKTRYVPEYLLKLWGINVNENWGHIAECMAPTLSH